MIVAVVAVDVNLQPAPAERVTAREPRSRQLGLDVLSGAVIVVTLFSFAWMILMSLKTQVQNTAAAPVWYFTPVLDNYPTVTERTTFLSFTRHSLIVALAATTIGMLPGLPAAYAVARSRRRGLGLWILISRIIPYITFLLPLFLGYSRLGLIGSFTALIASHPIVTLPIIIWITIAFFEDIPTDLEEAALVDGSSRAGVFVRIILPIIVLSLTVQRYIVRGLTAGGVKG